MKSILILLLIAFIQSAYDDTTIYNAIMSLQLKYPEGTKWDNSDVYYWKAKGTGIPPGGKGCVGFAMMASDVAFGDLPATKYTDKSKIRVGDILRLYGDTHSVIVLTKNGGTKYKIAEGNYGGTVHWGRIIDLASVTFNYGYTRYPN